MRAVDIIEKKKKNQELTKEEIDFLLEGYLKGEIPDYQMSSFLMAVYFNNMTKEELTYFTLKMRDSGDTIFFDNLDYYLVDKHSTGGVGDKVTVVLGPILSAVGMATTKLSGKGLGHTGGTIDKFESIENFRFSVTKEELVEIANKTGVGLMGYSDNIVPLDKKIYALRDVTATVDSIPLIASSIMSKKLAIQSNLIILDVKVGDGAFMKTIEDARELSRRMVEIGNSVGRKTIAVLTNMEEPLGYSIGNANEIIEGIEALKGNWSNDLKEVVYEIVYLALKHKGEVETFEQASKIIDNVIANGKALELLKEFIELSGGNGEVVNDYSLLPTPKSVLEVYSNEEGYITKIKAEEIGKAAMVIGAGRATKEDEVDHAVGLILKKKVGDKVQVGDLIAEIHYKNILEIIEWRYKMELNKYIDQTVLKATANKEDIRKLCEEAREYNFYSVCVNGCYVNDAKNYLEGTDVKVAAVVGFPLGAMTTTSKVFEAKEAIENGASEIDMVINVAKLKDQEYDYVREEIRQIKEVIGENVLKVIIETCYLTDEEKVKACELALAAKADFVKTSTGFGTGGATFEDVKLMKETVGNNAKVKASGGVKDKETAEKYIELGADRLGTSSGIAIME